jgi:hypothetical protein
MINYKLSDGDDCAFYFGIQLPLSEYPQYDFLEWIKLIVLQVESLLAVCYYTSLS